MRDEWIAALRRWAANNDSVAELWLFGRRANGTGHLKSDIDVAIELMPPIGNHNWALANFVQFIEDWKAELRNAVDWPIRLVAIGPNYEMDAEVRSTGVCLRCRH